jgi:hypothetical protein
MADTRGKGRPDRRTKVLTAVLDLSANHRIGPQQGVRLIAPLLAPVPTLYGGGCCFRLLSLDLNGAGVDDNAVLLLTKALMGGRTGPANAAAPVAEGEDETEGVCVAPVLLQSLYLRANRIGDVGAEALATAFAQPQCRRLNTLALQDNNIGDAGVVALLRLLQKRLTGNGDASEREGTQGRRKRQRQKEEARQQQQQHHQRSSGYHTPPHSAQPPVPPVWDDDDEEEEEEWDWLPSPPKQSERERERVPSAGIRSSHLDEATVTMQALEALAAQQLDHADEKMAAPLSTRSDILDISSYGEGSLDGGQHGESEGSQAAAIPTALKISIVGNVGVNEELGLLFAELQSMDPLKLSKMMRVMEKMRALENEDRMHTDVADGAVDAEGLEAVAAEKDAAGAVNDLGDVTDDELELLAAQQLLRCLLFDENGAGSSGSSSDVAGRDGRSDVRVRPHRRLWLDLADCELSNKGSRLLAEAMHAGIQRLLVNAEARTVATNGGEELVLMIAIDASRNKLGDEGVSALVESLMAVTAAAPAAAPAAASLDERIDALMGGGSGGDNTPPRRQTETTVLLSLDISGNSGVTDASAASLVQLVEHSTASMIRNDTTSASSSHRVALVLRTLGVASSSIGSRGRSSLQAALVRASATLGSAGADSQHSVASLLPMVRWGIQGVDALAEGSSIYGATAPVERDIHITAKPPKAIEGLNEQSREMEEAKMAGLLRQSKSDGSGGGALLPLPASNVEQQRWVDRWEQERREEEARLAAIARARAPPPALTLLYTDQQTADGIQQQLPPQRIASSAILTPQAVRASSVLSNVVLSPNQREAKKRGRSHTRAQVVVAQCGGEYVRVDGRAGGADAVLAEALSSALTLDSAGVTRSHATPGTRSYAAHAARGGAVAHVEAKQKKKKHTADDSPMLVYRRKKPLDEDVLGMAAKGEYLYLYYSNSGAAVAAVPVSARAAYGKSVKSTRVKGFVGGRGGQGSGARKGKGGVWCIGTLRGRGSAGARGTKQTNGKRARYSLNPVLWAPLPPSIAASGAASASVLLPLPLGACENGESPFDSASSSRPAVSVWHAATLSPTVSTDAEGVCDLCNLCWTCITGAVLVGGGVRGLGAVAARRKTGGGGAEAHAMAAGRASNIAALASQGAVAAMGRAAAQIGEAVAAAERNERKKKLGILPGIGSSSSESPAEGKKKKKKKKKGGKDSGVAGATKSSTLAFEARLPMLKGLMSMDGPRKGKGDDAGFSLILAGMATAEKTGR